MAISYHEVLAWVGAFCFGLVIGWVTYRTLRFSKVSGLSDLATVIGAVGGAAITGLFEKTNGAFSFYCVGLALGFFLYLRSAKDPDAPPWMGGNLGRSPANPGGGGDNPHDDLPDVH